MGAGCCSFGTAWFDWLGVCGFWSFWDCGLGGFFAGGCVAFVGLLIVLFGRFAGLYVVNSVVIRCWLRGFLLLYSICYYLVW